MSPHHYSTAAWVLLLAFATGAATGYYFGVRHAPTYHDALTIEKRLREVFCEQALKNKVLTSCEVFAQ